MNRPSADDSNQASASCMRPGSGPVGGRCEAGGAAPELRVGMGAHPKQFGVVDMHAGVQAVADPWDRPGAAVNKSPNKPDQSYRT